MTDYWHTGVCDCTSDCASCCITMWVPCVQYGMNAEKLDNSNCCLCGTAYAVFYCFACCFTWSQRTKVRAKYGIAGGCCSDALLSMFCEPCIMCQMSRELDFQLTHPKESNTVVYVGNGYVPPSGPQSYAYPAAAGYPAPGSAPPPSAPVYPSGEVPENASEQQALNPEYGGAAIIH